MNAQTDAAPCSDKVSIRALEKAGCFKWRFLAARKHENDMLRHEMKSMHIIT